VTHAGAGTQFNDPTVRDLAWLLFSPDLLSASHAGAPLAFPVESNERAVTLNWLAALDKTPAALHMQVHKPSLKRLGLYAEALLEYFLLYGPNARLVAANVPLRASGQTLGEVDFLLQNARCERLHWELAVKFYLHIGEGEGAPALSDYVGPNLQDRFDLKHDRLLNHQLGLSTRDEFASLGFEGPWRAELFVKGRLFYRRGNSPKLPSELAYDHLRGWWMTASEWRRESNSDDNFAAVPRLAWLAERTLLAEEAETLTFDADALTSPVMVANYDRGAGHIWRERSRGFIVPDEWPERALRYSCLSMPQHAYHHLKK
jgi:hypothetical protein